MAHIGNNSRNKKKYEMCQEVSFLNFGDGKQR